MSGRRTNVLRANGGLVTGERLERHGAGALADEELLAILVGKNGAHTAGALLEACRPGPWTRASSIPGRSSGRPRCTARLPIVPFHNHPYRVTPLRASTTSP